MDDSTNKALRSQKAALQAKLWWWVMVLSTAELYGCWMTFVPEWLSGSTHLAGTDEPVYLYFYLAFFNIVWIVVPGWLLVLAYNELQSIWVKTVTTPTTKDI